MASRCSRAISTSPSILLVLPAGLLIGLTFALLLGGFLLLGRHPSSVIFVSLGTLTGSYAADRLARGWYYLGGQNGIPSIPPMTLGGYEFTEGPPIYYLALGILVVVYLLCRFLVRSQFGLALAGLRENEQRIAFFGYKVQHLKAIIFSLGGAIAGLAGSLYAFHEGFVWPNMLGVVISTQVVLYVLFGGSGTLIGAVIGTVVDRGASASGCRTAIRTSGRSFSACCCCWSSCSGPPAWSACCLAERERVGSFGRPPGSDSHGAS